jgi:hypothetical protein
MNNKSHITEILKDKIDILESRGEKCNFTGSRGTVQLKLMRELTRSQSTQSKKAETVNYCYQWQILKVQWEKKGKEELHSFCKTPKATLKATAGMARLRGSAR